MILTSTGLLSIGHQEYSTKNDLAPCAQVLQIRYVISLEAVASYVSIKVTSA